MASNVRPGAEKASSTARVARSSTKTGCTRQAPGQKSGKKGKVLRSQATLLTRTSSRPKTSVGRTMENGTPESRSASSCCAFPR
ncbi:MAG: hypothetical protein IPF66_19275 [Holophagales bacterium]|nr:hypothetical protein [Holophagales bacterium]